MSRLRRIILAITFILAVFSCGFFAFAEDENKDENDGKYSLIIYDLCGEALVPVEGAEFTVSKVADLADNGSKYELRDMYEPSGVTSDDINSIKLASDVNEVIEKLMDAEISDPDAFSDKTDKNGMLEITGLTEGLYLVTAKTLTKGDEVYESTPALISVPSAEPGENQYQVTIYAKTSVLGSSEVKTTADETDETVESESEPQETTTAGETEDESEVESEESEQSSEVTGGDSNASGDITSGTISNVTVEDSTETETKSSGIIQTVTSMLTGDNAPILLLSIIVIVAFLVVVIQLIFIIKRKKNDKEEMKADE